MNVTLTNLLLAAMFLPACSGEAPRVLARAGGIEAVRAASVAEARLQDLRQELVGLQAEFARLSGLPLVGVRRDSRSDPAAATWFSLEHTRGLAGSAPVEQTALAEEGCYIRVEVVVYDPEQHPEIESPATSGGRDYMFFELDGGTRLALRELVLAPANDRGNAFLARVQPVVTSRLMQIWMELDAVVIDPNG